MNALQGKVALVTGASRGVGASVAVQLAERGADVVLNFRSKRPRAEAVAELVLAQGRQALLAQADLTNVAERQAMIESTSEMFSKLDLLILNASGGLEKEKPADYAWQLNVTAQVGVVETALPLMPSGSRIVFITSHPAHFYAANAERSHAELLPLEAASAERAVTELAKPSAYESVYEPVAASKYAGEQALRARLPDLAQRGIILIVVSGDLIENTITAKLLERAQPGLTEQRRCEVGTLLTVETFATVIVNAAINPALESGATVCA